MHACLGMLFRFSILKKMNPVRQNNCWNFIPRFISITLHYFEITFHKYLSLSVSFKKYVFILYELKGFFPMKQKPACQADLVDINNPLLCKSNIGRGIPYLVSGQINTLSNSLLTPRDFSRLTMSRVLQNSFPLQFRIFQSHHIIETKINTIEINR